LQFFAPELIAVDDGDEVTVEIEKIGRNVTGPRPAPAPGGHASRNIPLRPARSQAAARTAAD
jgi:hypothetical protein